MKKISTLFTLVILTISLFAQAPEKMSYQAVVRDAANLLLTHQTIGMQISILQTTANGTVVYSETQSTTTNDNGLVSIEIGDGTVVSGDFSTIDWANGPYFIKTETDPAGGIAYSITGTSQLMSVPYAMYSATSGSSIPGPIGPEGPQGLQGEQGIQGESGADGIGFPIVAVEGNMVTYDGTNWVAKNAVTENNGGGQAQNNMQPFLGIHHIIALQGIFPSRSSADPFIAEIIMFGGNFAPRGWAFCDGQLLPISQNTALFSLLGTTYGGDGRTTFGLPDLRGRVALHPGSGLGLPTYRLGEKGGTPTNTMNVTQMPAHNHTIIYQ